MCHDEKGEDEETQSFETQTELQIVPDEFEEFAPFFDHFEHSD